MTRPSEEPNQERRRTLLGAAGLAALLAGCSGAGSDKPSGTTTSTESSPSTTMHASDGTLTEPGEDTKDTTTAGSVEPSVTVNDQTTDGTFVVVARAAIDRPGWIGVHPSSADGGIDPNTHVGHAKLSAGRHEDVRAALEPLRDEGGTLYVVLHYDDPADGELTYPDGDPAVTIGGNPMRASFELTVEA